MLAVGGGSRSDSWMQMYADIYGKTITRTNVDQQAAALGAAALAAVGSGLWENFSKLDSVHQVSDQKHPQADQDFGAAYSRFLKANDACCTIAANENN